MTPEQSIELDSLKADLAAVEALLACRTSADDPIGWIQYSSRKTALQRQIAETVEEETTNPITTDGDE